MQKLRNKKESAKQMKRRHLTALKHAGKLDSFPVSQSESITEEQQ